MYFLAIKIEGIEKRRRSVGLLHIVLGFYLLAKGADYYRLLDFANFLPAAPIFLVALISLAYGFFRRQFDLTAKYNYWLRLLQVLTFTVLGVAFLKVGRQIDYIGVFVFAVISIVLMFSEKRIFAETNISFTNEGIFIPGYYRPHFVPWQHLTDVVVREDFLTIFHAKKKYLQYRVAQDLSILEGTKLNAFCKEQLERIGGKVNEEVNEKQ